MRILSPFKPLSVSISCARNREASTSSPVALLHRRSPFVRALCVLSIGSALSAIAFRTGCSQSSRYCVVLSKLKWFGLDQIGFLVWDLFVFESISNWSALVWLNWECWMDLLATMALHLNSFRFFSWISVYFIHFTNLHSSRFSNQASSRALHSAGMDAASATVPSIVVYVTVPNREAG